MTPAPQLPSIKLLGESRLRDAKGNLFSASSLWASTPALILITRRPGCILCRAEARRLWKLASEIQQLGVSMACVVHEWKDAEIAAFSPHYWGGPVYHDVDKSFYKAVNGGELLWAKLTCMLNPFGPFWPRILDARKVVEDHNVVGEGRIMGGLMVVGKGDEGVVFSHLEKELGQHADHAQVMAAVYKVAGAAPPVDRPVLPLDEQGKAEKVCASDACHM